MWEERLKAEFEKRFVGLIMNGERKWQYDWDKSSIEDWEWFCKTINSLLKEQKQCHFNLCLDNAMKILKVIEADNNIISDETRQRMYDDAELSRAIANLILNAPPPEGEKL